MIKVRITKCTPHPCTSWYEKLIGSFYYVKSYDIAWWATEIGDVRYFIRKDDCDVIENKFPRLKSGMVIQDFEGNRGIIAGQSILWINESAQIVGWDEVKEFRTGRSKFNRIVKVYEGSSKTPAALHASDLKNLIWAKATEIKLNDQYTAEILPNGRVKVGCQEFEADRILELADRITLNKL